MGLLDRWDRRNQETAEYHNETADSIDEIAGTVFGTRFWSWYLATWALSALLGVALRASGLSEDAAAAARVAILFAITATLFVWAVRQARRRRAEWRRQRATDTGGL